MNEAVVELANVTAGYGGKPVLSGLSLHIEKGEMLIVEGATGSGKTTLMKLLLAAIEPTAGFAKAAGIELRGASRNERTMLRRHMGVVFQAPRFLGAESVLVNVTLPLAIAGVSPARCRAEATRALIDAGLSAAARKRPGGLSGGEQARLQIARALVNKPYLLLADEPFAHLDPDSAAEAEQMLSRAHERGTTVLITTHRPTALAKQSRRLTLELGRLK